MQGKVLFFSALVSVVPGLGGCGGDSTSNAGGDAAVGLRDLGAGDAVVAHPDAWIGLVGDATRVDTDAAADAAVSTDAMPIPDLAFLDSGPPRTDAVVPDPDAGPVLPPGHLWLDTVGVDFGPVAAGESGAPVGIALSNLGNGPLFIDALIVSGPGFTVALDGTDLAVEPELLGDPDGDGHPGVAPHGGFVLPVGYTSPDGAPVEGELTIRPGADGAAETAIPLFANHADPCLRVRPAALDLGTLPVGAVGRAPLTLMSCGGSGVRLDAIALSPDSDPAIALLAESLPTLPALLPHTSRGEPLPSRDVQVSCQPGEARAYAGTVDITSSDPTVPVVHVPVTCAGAANACPVPAVVQARIEAHLLQPVVLDGSASTDPDGPAGHPVRYTWMLVDAPQGSEAFPVEQVGPDPANPSDGATPDDETTPTAQFLVDVAGTYVFRLSVEDNLGLVAPSDACPEPVAGVTVVVP